jgi:hypothetical protein
MLQRERAQAMESNAGTGAWPVWFERCFLVALVISAVATDWYCAFEWFSKQCPFFSGPVISRMLAIVLSCAAIGFLTPLLRRTKWQVGVVMFFITSITVSCNILLWWVGHR